MKTIKIGGQALAVAAILLGTFAFSVQPVAAMDCAEYSRSAVQQQKENLRLSCGFSGPEWNEDFNYHNNWCRRGISQADLSKGYRLRQSKLDSCRRR